MPTNGWIILKDGMDVRMAFCREEVELGHQEATFNMATLNRIAADLKFTF